MAQTFDLAAGCPGVDLGLPDAGTARACGAVPFVATPACRERECQRERSERDSRSIVCWSFLSLLRQ